jgi:hypothetical protein
MGISKGRKKIMAEGGFPIYCKECGEIIGSTDIENAAEVAKDSIVCVACVINDPVDEEEEEEEVEDEVEEEKEKDN